MPLLSICSSSQVGLISIFLEDIFQHGSPTRIRGLQLKLSFLRIGTMITSSDLQSVVFDLITEFPSYYWLYLRKHPGLVIKLIGRDQEKTTFGSVLTLGYIGTENKIHSDHTCLGFVRVGVSNPNDVTSMEFSAFCSAYSLKTPLTAKAWGIHLLYGKEADKNVIHK
ncbi:hypothetical protein ACH5RR_038847 [Cinchona calisaya]|uniref:Uncharacterized protein n=1 Tax=Cinchona calisaya TaxID=153742 RepID=A0ABD2XWH6_9GENT